MAAIIRAVKLEDAGALADLARDLGEFSSVTQEVPAVTFGASRAALGDYYQE